jgi:hypothetical protein
MSREQFGKIDSSTFEIAIPIDHRVQSGQWVVIDRMGLRDHGQIVAVDRRSPSHLKLTVDTAKVAPIDFGDQLAKKSN